MGRSAILLARGRGIQCALDGGAPQGGRLAAISLPAKEFPLAARRPRCYESGAMKALADSPTQAPAAPGGPAAGMAPAGSASPPPLTRRAVIALLLLLAVAALVRGIGLGEHALWVDEAFSYNYAKPDEPYRWEHFFGNLHGPLHAVTLHLWMQVAGHSEAALRFPSLVASLLTVLCFFFYARRIWGESTAWLGAALLAIAPFHVWYAQESRNYALLILFAVLAEWAFERLRDRGPRGALLAGYGLALLAGFLSNLSMAFLVVVHAVRLFLLWRAPRPRLRLSIVAVWVLVAIALSPWAHTFYQARIQESHLLRTESVAPDERLREQAPATPLGIPYTFYVFSTGYSFGPGRRELWIAGPQQAFLNHAPRVALAAGIFGLLWLLGLARLYRRNAREAGELLTWHALPLLLLLFIALRNVKVINPRYVAVVYPAFVATLALGAARLPLGRRPGVRVRERAGPPRPAYNRIGLLLFAGALAVSAVATVRNMTVEAYRKEDYRSVAAHLERALGPGDAVLTIGIDQPLRSYYMRGPLRRGEPAPWTDLGRLVRWRTGTFVRNGEVRTFEAGVLERWAAGQRLFVAIARPWTADPQGMIEAELRAAGTLVSEHTWSGVRLLELERRVGGG